MEIITDIRAKELHTKCSDLTDFNLNSVAFMNQLVSLMKKKSGFGLAAPQVGMPLNAFVMMAIDGRIFRVINPKILEKGKIVTSKQEGCLSIPNKRYNVKRSKRIKVEFKDEVGKKIKTEFRNHDAFVFQHEYDHLQGILISD